MRHKGKERKFNCWEFKHCGREKGGAKTAELGVCPASTETVLDRVHDGTNCGRACWVMEGTLCAASVQGSFLEKFKRCIACDFFHHVEAQEGGNLRNAKELLQIVEAETAKKVGERIQDQVHAIASCPGCGQELTIAIGPNWKVNIVGLVEFQCRKCGRIVRTKGLLAEASDNIVVIDMD